MQKIVAVLVIAAVPILYFLYRYQYDKSFLVSVPQGNVFLVHVGTVPIHVELADTPELWMKGLGGRTYLGETNGMLFIFDKSDHHQIWMKDMHIPIDVLWIDERMKVIDIKKRLDPNTYPRTFEPRSPARFIIETNADYVESFDISIGDTVSIPSALIPTDLR